MTTKISSPEQIKRTEKQIVECVLTEHFFSCLLLELKRSYTDEIPTMATDGVRLLINPEFVSTLDEAEIRGVLVHEVLHNALGHPWRKGDRDHTKCNMAMDYAINLEIDDYIHSGARLALPKGALLDQKYRGMSWEQIYAQLPDPPKGDKGGGGKGSGDGKGNGMGEVLDGGHTKDETSGKTLTDAEMAAKWKGKMAQAAQAARMQGKLPAGIARLVDDTLAPKIPWRSVLRRFLTDVVHNDYDWLKPDRRFLPDDIYIPDIGDEEAAGEVVVVVDTSGSVTDEIISEFFAEIRAIHGDLKPSNLRVMYCDAAVHEPVDEFGPEDTVIANPKGGGGTSFAPPFDWLVANHVEPKAVVYLTDLYGSHWDKIPGYPVLWACWSNEETIPFGELVKVS
jgi:predicted metal-dependent peptidase